jgi:hypothetical protein
MMKHVATQTMMNSDEAHASRAGDDDTECSNSAEEKESMEVYLSAECSRLVLNLLSGLDGSHMVQVTSVNSSSSCMVNASICRNMYSICTYSIM